MFFFRTFAQGGLGLYRKWSCSSLPGIPSWNPIPTAWHPKKFPCHYIPSSVPKILRVVTIVLHSAVFCIPQNLMVTLQHPQAINTQSLAHSRCAKDWSWGSIGRVNPALDTCEACVKKNQPTKQTEKQKTKTGILSYVFFMFRNRKCLLCI